MGVASGQQVAANTCVETKNEDNLKISREIKVNAFVLNTVEDKIHFVDFVVVGCKLDIKISFHYFNSLVISILFFFLELKKNICKVWFD